MRSSALLTLAVAVAACSGKKESPAAAPPPTSGTAAAVPVDAAPPPPPPAPIDQAAVDQVLADWLAAQNGGDFAAYQGLYAERMEGVKRVGPKMWRFDRAGWMADRKKMFAKPMVVTAADRTITGSVAAPVVEFTQTFQQARFADSGRKRMVLTRHQGHYRIAREEMLASTVGAPPAATAGAVIPTLEIDGRWFAVLAADAEPTWATGAIAGPYQGVHRYALRAATAAPTAGSWLGKPLALYDRAGARCDATVASLHLLGGGTPHFGEIQAWDGDPDSGGTHVYSQAERAQAIYDLSAKYLVGELTITGGCKPAYAATPDRALVPYGEVAVPDAQKSAAIAAFRGLPGYGHGEAALRAIAEQERAGAVHAAERLRAAGFAAPVVSVGSTPTALFAEQLAGVTEVRAGVYVFMDLMMAALGVCRLDEIAASVLTAVIGHQPDRGWTLIDAGWMALSRDRGLAGEFTDQGLGLVCDAAGSPIGEDGGEWIVSAANQEHGIVTHRSGDPARRLELPVGTLLRVLPNHACATAAQHAHYDAAGGGRQA
jgi:ketosteroid isomerase-like protein